MNNQLDLRQLTAVEVARARSSDYWQLLRRGFCSGTLLIGSDPGDTSEEYARWRDTVAAAWFREIEKLIARDGLRIKTFLGTPNDGLMRDSSPVAELVFRDGTGFEPAHKRENIWDVAVRERAMSAEWGDVLASARKRAGVFVHPPPAPQEEVAPEPPRRSLFRWLRRRPR
jgi:hypothetical protein